MRKPIAASLFSGAGYFDYGFQQEGFDVRVGVEIVKSHCEQHERNFPDTTMLNTSVEDVDAILLKHVARADEFDLVMGGSPCQAFSIQGKRRRDDPRSLMIFQFARIVRELQPKHFVFENVKAITYGEALPQLEAFLKECDRAGYDITMPYKVLNAKDFGVAQSRERLFILGSRKGLPLIQYPDPMGDPPTCFDVMHDLENRTADVAHLSGNTLVQHSANVVERFAKVIPGEKDTISRFHRLKHDGIAPTITAGTLEGSGIGGPHTARRHIHYNSHRVLTVRETARLHGIDDSIKLGNPYQTTHEALLQIGNSVPPPMGAAIARQVKKAIQIS